MAGRPVNWNNKSIDKEPKTPEKMDRRVNGCQRFSKISGVYLSHSNSPNVSVGAVQKTYLGWKKSKITLPYMKFMERKGWE